MLLEDFDKDLIQQVLDSLIVENMLIFLSSKTFEPSSSEYQVEKWYNTKYLESQLEKSFVQRLKHP